MASKKPSDDELLVKAIKKMMKNRDKKEIIKQKEIYEVTKKLIEAEQKEEKE